jgi:hypothetical protein
MKRLAIILAVVFGVVAIAAALTAPAWTQDPAEKPFPSPKVSLFMSVRTVTAPGSGFLTNFFPQGSDVTFQMFAADTKSRTALTDKDIKYAYIAIPGQPNVKLTYSVADPQWPWTGTWTIPADFVPRLVEFKANVKTSGKQYGSFVQIPVMTSQLTVTKA